MQLASGPRRLLVITFVSGLGVAWLLHVGPVPVIRITTPLEEFAPFWYMFLAFPILGVLIADLVDLWCRRRWHRSFWWLAAQIGVLVAVSNLRLGIRLPISGHALVAAFLLTRRLTATRPWSRVAIIEAASVGAIAAALTYVKLVWWTDPITLLVGVAGGVALALSGPKDPDSRTDESAVQGSG